MNSDTRDKLNKLDELLQSTFWIMDIWAEHLADKSEISVANGVLCLLSNAKDILEVIQKEITE